MNNKIYLAAAFALALTACTNENDNPIQADGEVAAQVIADIGSVYTRVSGNAWTQDDEIGISTVDGTKTDYTNIPYKYDGGTFKPSGVTIYFQSPEVVTFNAYYPYAADGGIVTAKTDAVAQKDLPAIDFLFAEGATASKTAPTVAFTDKTADNGGKDNSFHHCMSQITLELTEGSDIAFTGALTEYTLKGLVLDGTFDTTTGEAKADAETAAAPLTMALTNVTSTGGKYTTAPVILFPQAVNSIGLEIEVDGQTYKATLTLANGLEAGNNYIFPVTVKKTGLSVGTAEITDWNKINGTSTDAVM